MASIQPQMQTIRRALLCQSDTLTVQHVFTRNRIRFPVGKLQAKPIKRLKRGTACSRMPVSKSCISSLIRGTYSMNGLLKAQWGACAAWPSAIKLWLEGGVILDIVFPGCLNLGRIWSRDACFQFRFKVHQIGFVQLEIQEKQTPNFIIQECKRNSPKPRKMPWKYVAFKMGIGSCFPLVSKRLFLPLHQHCQASPAVNPTIPIKRPREPGCLGHCHIPFGLAKGHW